MAMLCGADSPITQTFGLGLWEPVGTAEFDRLEGFFLERGAHVHHEISPLADKELWPQIADRGYAAIEFTSVMFQELAFLQPAPEDGEVQIRVATAQDREVYIRTSLAGWSHVPDIEELVGPMMDTAFSAKGAVLFLAEKDGIAIATGGLNIHGGVALLAGASTIPEARRQGAQRALLSVRLKYAREAGCDIAAIGAEPGSASQRNAERQGFRIAYTRTKWELRKNSGIMAGHA